jgi:formate/nitrite transporter FocA (FNT family)
MESKEIQEVRNVAPSFLAPGGIAKAIVGVGKAKTSLSVIQMIILGILAGAFIGFGSELATMVSYDMSKFLGVGFTKFIFGSVFSVGLILVVIAGAELFTGNSLIFISVIGFGSI